MEIIPSLNADSLLALESADFRKTLSGMENKTGSTIHSLDDYKSAISARLALFDNSGCLLADHSLDDSFEFIIASEDKAEPFFFCDI